MTDKAGSPAAVTETRGTLLPQHEKLISDSAITRDVAEARGYRSVEGT